MNLRFSAALLAALALPMAGCALFHPAQPDQSAQDTPSSTAVPQVPSVVLIVGIYRYTPDKAASPTILMDMVQNLDSEADLSPSGNGDLYATLNKSQGALQEIWKTLSSSGKVDIISDSNITTQADSVVTLSSDQGSHGAEIPVSAGAAGYALTIKVSNLNNDNMMLDMDGHIIARPVFSNTPVEWDTHNHGIVKLYHSAIFVSSASQGGPTANGAPSDSPTYYVVCVTPVLGH